MDDGKSPGSCKSLLLSVSALMVPNYDCKTWSRLPLAGLLTKNPAAKNVPQASTSFTTQRVWQTSHNNFGPFHNYLLFSHTIRQCDPLHVSHIYFSNLLEQICSRIAGTNKCCGHLAINNIFIPDIKNVALYISQTLQSSLQRLSTKTEEYLQTMGLDEFAALLILSSSACWVSTPSRRMMQTMQGKLCFHQNLAFFQYLHVVSEIVLIQMHPDRAGFTTFRLQIMSYNVSVDNAAALESFMRHAFILQGS